MKFKYHPYKSPVIVKTKEEEVALGPDWYNSPAEFGVETEGNHIPDAQILKNKEAFEEKENLKIQAAIAEAKAAEEKAEKAKQAEEKLAAEEEKAKVVTVSKEK